MGNFTKLRRVERTKEMALDNHERNMAEDNFGYGRWDAPYWFIGPEQGMGAGAKKDEKNEKRNVAAVFQSGAIWEASI
jgi:hypothetical protein